VVGGGDDVAGGSACSFESFCPATIVTPITATTAAATM